VARQRSAAAQNLSHASHRVTLRASPLFGLCPGFEVQHHGYSTPPASSARLSLYQRHIEARLVWRREFAVSSMQRLKSALRRSHPQQPFGVATGDLRLVLIAQRHAREPGRTRSIPLDWIVDGERDAIDAHLLDAEKQRRIGEEAAGRNREVR